LAASSTHPKIPWRFYNSAMTFRNRLLVGLLVLCPLLLSPLLGIGPRPVGLDREQAATRLSLENNSPEGAAEHLAKVIEYLPWREGLRETAGQAALAAGDFPAAIEQFEAAERAGVITPAGYLALGDAYRGNQEWESAEEAWLKALNLGAEPVPALNRLLDTYRQAGDYASAISALQLLTEINPDDAAAQYQLGLMMAAREPQAALGFLLRAAALDDGLARTVRQLERGLEPDPEIDDPAFNLVNAGRTLGSLGEWELAAEAFRQATLSNPNYPDAWAFLGEALQQTGEAGETALQNALRLDPASLTGNLLYGIYLKRANQYTRALEFLGIAESVDPENAAVLAEIASTYGGLGDIQNALDYFFRAIDLEPENPTYYHLLAQYSIFSEIQVEEIGLPAARQAILMDGKDFIALDLVGYAYYQKNDPASGQRFLLQALESNPNYAPARLHLGLLYLNEGEMALAARQFQLVQSLAPGTPAGRQAESILQRYLP